MKKIKFLIFLVILVIPSYSFATCPSDYCYVATAATGSENCTEGNECTLSQANAMVDAGDTIHLADGTYTDIGVITTSADGSSGNEITVIADQQGDVIFTGDTKFDLYGDYWIFKYLDFNSTDTREEVFLTRNENSQITYCRFYDIAATTTIIYIQAGTENFEIDHNLFDSTGQSPALMPIYSDIRTVQDWPKYVNINNNTFSNSDSYGQIGCGTGNGQDSTEDIYYTIEHNTFDTLSGNKGEIIVGKSSSITIRYNTFVDCVDPIDGTLKAVSIRSGDDDRVYNNTFTNVDIPIRVQGTGHWIYNNIAYDFNLAAFLFVNGPYGVDCNVQTPTNNYIAYNTLIGLANQEAVSISNNGDADCDEAPNSNYMYDNIFIVDHDMFDTSDWTNWEGNNTVDTNLFDALDDGDITDANMGANYIEDNAGLTGSGVASRLDTGSAAIDAALDVPSWPDPTIDIDDEVRPMGTSMDIGCDEFTQTTLSGISFQ